MDKTILITGASSGIGYALAVELAAKGMKVIATARRADKLQKLKSLYHDHIEILSADLASEGGRNRLLTFLSNYTLNYIVHNAGIITPIGPLGNVPQHALRVALEVNLIAPMLLTNALLPTLHDARVLNISSCSAEQAAYGLGSYCVTKAALNMWIKTQQLELKNKNILLTNVIPGEVDTDMQKTLRTSCSTALPQANEFKAAEELGKLISTQTCADFLSWLLLNTSDEQFPSKDWNIYDESHHHYWLKEPLPLPYNQMKMAM